MATGIREQVKRHLTSVPEGDMVQMAKAIRDDLRQSLVKELSVCLSKMEEAQERHWKRMEAFLKALPIPQVTVSPAEVTVKQLPSQVTVNVPETRPADIHVNIPKQEAQVVNNIVNVPQQAAPTINVENKIEPTPINVNLPETVVNSIVNVPEQAAPQVLFNVPKDGINLQVAVEQNLILPKRKTTSEKLVQFDTGRQARVLETLTEEDE